MASFHKPNFIMSLKSKNIGFQLLLKTVHHLVSSVILVHPYLCLYNQLFALFHYVFKFLTP